MNEALIVIGRKNYIDKCRQIKHIQLFQTRYLPIQMQMLTQMATLVVRKSSDLNGYKMAA